MRLFEFVDAEAQMALWKLISDSVWTAIDAERQKQAQAAAHKPVKQPKSSPSKSSAKRASPPTPPKPRTLPKKTDSKTDARKDAEAKQKSAQLAQQRQQAQAAVKSTDTPITTQQQKQQVLPKAFTDTAQSNAATRPLPSSTAASLAAQNAVRARSIAQTQRSLYPLAHDEVVKRLTS